MRDRPLLKAYSTRRVRPPPPEFEATFVEQGWSVVNRMYGKRAAQRWFIALGPARLRHLRDAHEAAVKAARAGR